MDYKIDFFHVFFFLFCMHACMHASLLESLVNVMVSDLIRQPRGLSGPALQWAGRGLVQASHCSPCLSGDVHIECDRPFDLNSSAASMWERTHSV